MKPKMKRIENALKNVFNEDDVRHVMGMLEDYKINRNDYKNGLHGGFNEYLKEVV